MKELILQGRMVWSSHPIGKGELRQNFRYRTRINVPRECGCKFVKAYREEKVRREKERGLSRNKLKGK